MKRRLFNLTAVVSLVMMLAVVAMWLRSVYRCDLIRQNREHEVRIAWSDGGMIAMGRFPHGPEGSHYTWLESRQREGSPTYPVWIHIDEDGRWLSVPTWMLALLPACTCVY